MDNSAKIGFCPKFLAFATSFARGENDMVFIGKKALIFAVAAVLSLTIASLGIFAVAKTVGKMSFPVGAVVVIDAGHGGGDGGVVGVTGTKESELNLELALKLGELLEARGVGVVYTRTSDEALSDIKREDMKMRADIIANSRPDCVVSIHLNSYSDRSRRGVQVFYDDTGRWQSFASLLQERLNAQINYKYSKRSDLAPQAGDYYITKCAAVPSVIIECGFISNAEDERLLNTDSFRRELCVSIADAVLFALS